MRSDVQEIERFLDYVFAPTDIYQMRAVGETGGIIRGLYQGNHDVAAAHGAYFSDVEQRHAFFGLNPLRPDSPQLRGRTFNKLVRPDSGLKISDTDIAGRRLLLLDLDPKRPAKTAATAEQRHLSRATAGKVREYLSSLNWPEPVVGFSGNGIHLDYRLTGDPIETPVISAIIRHLNSLFETPLIRLDPSVADLGRVCRLYGTINNKGGASSLSHVVSYPDAFEAVPTALLLNLARLGGYLDAEERRVRNAERPRTDEITVEDIEDLIAIDYRGVFQMRRINAVPPPESDGSQRFYFAECPNVGRRHEHGGNSYITREENGELKFFCFAEKCHNTTFSKLLRNLYARTGKKPSHPKLQELMNYCGVDVTEQLAAWTANADAKAVAVFEQVEWEGISPVFLKGTIAQMIVECDESGADASRLEELRTADNLQAIANFIGQAGVDKLRAGLVKSCVITPRGNHLPAPARLLSLPDRPRLYVDFESRSETHIELGVYKYLEDPSTRATVLAYAFDDGEVVILDLWHGDPLPPEFVAALNNSAIQKVAWNSAFDSMILRESYGVKIDLADWLDASTVSRYANFPPSLAAACVALKIGIGESKDKSGKALIRLFAAPQKSSSKEIAAGAPPTFWASSETHPEEWEAFKSYCARDIVSMRECLTRIETHTKMPKAEHELWMVDQVINDRGIAVDSAFVDAACKVVEETDIDTIKRMKDLTGLGNPGSAEQLKSWMAGQGVTMKSCDKEHVEEALAGVLPDKVREALLLRQRQSGAGAGKLKAIKSRILNDGSVKGCLYYYGGHLGRWSSFGAQIHNMAKPSKDLEDRIEELTESIRTGNGVPADCDPVEAITSVVRSSFRPIGAYRYVVSDFSSVESRVLGWVTECPAMKEIFESGRDGSKTFAAKIHNKPYDDVTKRERNEGKPSFLGCGYQLGAKGLMASAKKYGIILSEPTARAHVDTFRHEYVEIPAFWNGIEKVCVASMRNGTEEEYKCFRVSGKDKRFLEIVLPTGRSLFYQDFRVEYEGGKDRPTLSYQGKHSRENTYGGKLCENLIQACARDLLVDSLLECEREGMRVVFSVHDELVIEVPKSHAVAIRDRVEQIMSKTPAWAPGLLLGAATHVRSFYQK